VHGAALLPEHVVVGVPAPAKPYIPKLVQLPESVIEYLKERYELDEGKIQKQGWAWTYWMGGALAMPIRNRWFNVVGFNLRTLKAPKRSRIILCDPSSEVLAYYIAESEPAGILNNAHLPLLVVEDQLSALKASKWLNSVALCGTNLSDGKVVDLTKTHAKHVIIALDNDASHKAVDYLRKYSVFFDKLSVLLLDKDIKDCSENEIVKLLKKVP
jgi:DNA primase